MKGTPNDYRFSEQAHRQGHVIHRRAEEGLHLHHHASSRPAGGFHQGTGSIDLSQGPEILVLDEMQVTIMEFSKSRRKTSVTQLGKVGQ